MNYIPPESLPSSELVRIAMTPYADEIVAMSEDDIRTFPIRERFKAIAKIKDRVINLSPAPKNDPRRPVNEEQFADEVSALVKISETMRHSRAYMEWLDLCRDYLTVRLYEHSMYMSFLKKWDKADVTTRRGVHKIQERLHTDAANETFKSIFENARLEFKPSPRRKDPIPARRTIREGSFRGLMESRDPKRRITLNTHSDSSFSDAPKSLGYGYHEKKHDLGFQLGWLISEGHGDELDEQFHDGNLWFALKKEKAVIPGRIRSAYRAQFHEVVAFAEGDKWTEITRQMMKLGFVPPTI